VKPLALVAATAASLATLTAGCGGTTSATLASQRVSYLWAIPSASGSLTGPNGQQLTLRLVGVRDYLTRFTERPVRKAYVVANVDFVRRFKSYFEDSTPNAVLSYRLGRQAIPVAIVLQLGQPRWDPKTSTMTFPARRVPHMEDNLPDTTIHIKPPFIANPRHFNDAGLFIDSASTAGSSSQTQVISSPNAISTPNP
jgi:hypothetical protein